MIDLCNRMRYHNNTNLCTMLQLESNKQAISNLFGKKSRSLFIQCLNAECDGVMDRIMASRDSAYYQCEDCGEYTEPEALDL